MNEILQISPKDFICPFCKQKVQKGEVIGKAHLSVEENTKYRIIFIGIEKKYQNRDYDIYCCPKCFRKKKFFDKLLTNVFLVDIVIILLFLIYGLFAKDDDIVFSTLFFGLILFVISLYIASLIKKVMMDDQIKYEQALNFNALVAE